MTLSQALATLVDNTVESSALIPHNGFHLEPRCRVCRNDELRTRVNEMLATGTSYAMVLRSLAADNDSLDIRDKVTIDSIRNHCQRHFPVQNVAKAMYRDILERRARENEVDFVDGVSTAITPLAYYEVAMNKAFRTMVDDRTEVSVETGLRAAEKLQSVLDGRERGTGVLELKVQLAMIGKAVRFVVPQQMWGRSSRSWMSWRRIRRPSKSTQAPSMTQTTSRLTPWSSPSGTTSSDLRSAHRHRGSGEPLPVWTGCGRQRLAWCGQAAMWLRATPPLQNACGEINHTPGEASGSHRHLLTLSPMVQLQNIYNTLITWGTALFKGLRIFGMMLLSYAIAKAE